MSHDTIAQIKPAADCIELFRRFFPKHYRPHGNSVCPFHGDSDPSLSLQRDRAHCFGEGKSWDAIDLYEAGAGVTKREAIEALSREYGIMNQGSGNGSTSRMAHNPRSDPRLAKDTYPPVDHKGRWEKLSSTPLSDDALAYLESRGRSKSLISALARERSIGFNPEWAAVAFPVTDLKKKDLHGIQFIPIDGSDKKFARGTTTTHGFLRFGTGGDYTVVTEAVIDALSVLEACSGNDVEVVCIYSANAWKKVAEIPGSDVVLFFDNDPAGIKATCRALKEFRGKVHLVNWNHAPKRGEGRKPAKDVNDLLRIRDSTGNPIGAEAIERMVRFAKHYIDDKEIVVAIDKQLANLEEMIEGRKGTPRYDGVSADFERFRKEMEAIGAMAAVSTLRENGAENMHVHDWPILDPAAFWGIAGNFVALACRNSEADPAAVLVTFLSRAAVEMGAGPHVTMGDSRHFARLFAVIVGASSKARKGTSGKPVTKVFDLVGFRNGLDAYIPARTTPGPLSSGEGLIFAVRDEAREWKVNKNTGGGEWVITDPGVQDKRLFVLDEELAGGLHATKREGNTLSVILRSAWDNGTLEPLTKTTRTKATGAHIGIVSHVTLAELNRLLDNVNALNGFANRFLWICARRQRFVALPEPMPEDELSALQQRLITIMGMARRTGQVDFSDAAKELWRSIYSELSADHPGLVGAVINRAEANTLRLALIYTLLDGRDIIEADHLRAGLAVWKYAETSARLIFEDRQANPTAQKILDALENGPLPLTDIHHALSNHATKLEMQTALNELSASGRIEIAKESPTGGRGRTINTIRLREKCEKGGLNTPEARAERINSHFPHNSQSDSQPDSNDADLPLIDMEVF